jgi:ubiquitin-conjugating enzyme E2 C
MNRRNRQWRETTQRFLLWAMSVPRSLLKSRFRRISRCHPIPSQTTMNRYYPCHPKSSRSHSVVQLKISKHSHPRHRAPFPHRLAVRIPPTSVLSTRLVSRPNARAMSKHQQGPLPATTTSNTILRLPHLQPTSILYLQVQTSCISFLTNPHNNRHRSQNRKQLQTWLSQTQQSARGTLTPLPTPHPANLLTLLSLSLQKELMDLMLHPTPGISAFPSDENMSLWTATIDGPSGTPYASLILKLTFEFPSNYPYAPPTVLFKTPIYHPNVDFSGRICLDILKDKWSAVYNVGTVLLSLQSLLGEPNK